MKTEEKMKHTRWTSVKKKLPGNSKCVLGFYDNGYMGMVFYCNKKWYKMWCRETVKITHWRYLPYPPSEDAQ